MTYQVIEPNGRDFMRDAARPFALVQIGKRQQIVINRYATRELANAARRRRLRVR